MLRRHNHISHAKCRIRTRCKHLHLFVQCGSVFPTQLKIEFSTLRTSNPIDLLRLNSINKVKVVQIINQSVGIFGNRHHPLLFVFAHHLRSAAFATAINHFFVSQAHFARRAPVNGDFIFISQPFFKQLNKHPLRPLIILRVASRYTSVPVKAKAE